MTDQEALAEIAQTKKFTQAWLDDVGFLYSIGKDDENNNIWAGITLKLSGSQYQANGFDSTNLALLNMTYSIQQDGSIKMTQGSDGYSWIIKILNVTNNYIQLNYEVNKTGYFLLDPSEAKIKLSEEKYGYIAFGNESGFDTSYLNGKTFYSVNLDSEEGNTRVFENGKMKTGETISSFDDINGQSYSITSDGRMKLILDEGGEAYFELMDSTSKYLLFNAYTSTESRLYKYYFNQADAIEELYELQHMNTILNKTTGFTANWLDEKVLYMLPSEGGVYAVKFENGFQTIYNSDESIIKENGVEYVMPYSVTNEGYLKVDETALNNGVARYEYYKITDIGGDKISVLAAESLSGLVNNPEHSYFYTNYQAIPAAQLGEIKNGTEGNDILNGSPGNDILNGGAGADKMAGGLGDDTYFVDNIKDKVTEKVLEGTADTIKTTLSTFSLANIKEVEHLTYTGTSSTILTGSKIDNHITGSTGNDTLDGGLGNDTLTGGAGNDNFKFTSKLSTTNFDTISDFSSADDTIQLSKKIFKAVSKGFTADNLLIVGDHTADTNDYIIYDQTIGKLYYDVDGSGVKVAVEFAVLTGVDTVSASDFSII